MYRNLNDYEIIYMVGEQKDDSFNILYDKYKPLISKIASSYVQMFRKFGYDKDDIMQVGYIVLYKSSYMYDVHNNSMFYTYFKSAFEKALIVELRNNSTYKKEILNNAISYDTNLPNSNVSYLELLEDTKTNDIEEFKNLIIQFKNSMNFTLSCLFELFYNGYNIGEISLLLDIKKTDVIAMIKEIKRHALTYRYLFLK